MQIIPIFQSMLYCEPDFLDTTMANYGLRQLRKYVKVDLLQYIVNLPYPVGVFFDTPQETSKYVIHSTTRHDTARVLSIC